jgi:integrase
MASIYKPNGCETYTIAYYPQAGCKPVRTALGTTDPELANKMLKKVELLLALEKYHEIPLPQKLLGRFHLPTIEVAPPPLAVLPQPAALPPAANAVLVQEALSGDCEVRKAISLYLNFYAEGNAHGLSDKISRLRLFFGSELIEELDPRPKKKRAHAGKREIIEPWFTGKYLGDITSDTLVKFLNAREYKRSNKRHYREVFFGLFRRAMVAGHYKPANIYAPNPAGELPSYKGNENTVVVLDDDQVRDQLLAVESDKEILFGVQLMIEAGFRLHEILALRPKDFAPDYSSISLVNPEVRTKSDTKLKTGERNVTVREVLKPIIRDYLSSYNPTDSPWLFRTRTGLRLTSNMFSERLRNLNAKKELPWTSQDYRHTFATNRIKEGWNVKTLADEMGTSITMLCEYYAGTIKAPILAAQSALSHESAAA